MKWLVLEIKNKLCKYKETNIYNCFDLIIMELEEILSLIDQANCNKCRFNNVCDKKLVIDEDSQDFTNIDYCNKFKIIV